MSRMSPPRPTDSTDLSIGFLGFFALAFLVITIVCELRGEPALTWALVLLALVAGVVVAVRHRAALLRRSRLPEGPDPDDAGES